MSKIAFIGLGIMGAPMARNLLSAGHDVVAHNRSPHKTALFVLEGGRGADSVAEAVVGAHVVATMLPDTPDVEAVLSGSDGVFTHAKAGTLVIDFSTIRPDVSAALAHEGERLGVRVLDAPVSGGEQGAIEANLSIMVGGDPEAFAAAHDIFAAVGKTVVHVGPAGSGQTVKAANQLIVAGNLELVAEALVFLEAHGVDVPSAVTVLDGGLAGSTVLRRKAQAMQDRAFTPGFRIALHHKDMNIVTSSARERGIVIPLGAVVAQLIAALDAQGYGDLDHSSLFKLVVQLSGRQ
jgi:2-hydroxy-3-oxopropionate reductase